jgi:endonuclease/exonuclease/phosphatase family metal-dependent hydrolase
MPFFRRLALALFATAAIAQAAAPATPRTLRVLSYNIHHGEGVDGKLELTRLGAIIASSGADLVALQEVDQKATRTKGIDQAAELAALTGLHHAYGKAMDFQGGAYGQALLSRWPLENFTVHPLPNPAKVEPRIAISATVRPPGLPPVRFIGTHLDATRDETARVQQTAKLNELFATDDTLTILVGDFNARPDTNPMKPLLAVWADASIGNPQPTIPAKNPTSRIDYVLLRPAGVWRVVSSTVLPEAVASDHRPLLVELALVSR